MKQEKPEVRQDPGMKIRLVQVSDEKFRRRMDRILTDYKKLFERLKDV